MIRTLALILLAAPAAAQDGVDHSATESGDAMAGYMAAMDAMMADMAGMEVTGHPDADFLMMMIPHHESAVAMARVELEQGGVGPVRDLAERIIADQEAEIEEMRAMLMQVLRANP